MSSEMEHEYDGTGSFQDELRSLINRHSQENGSNTPDFILANYLLNCLETFNQAVRERDRWYGLPESFMGTVTSSDLT